MKSIIAGAVALMIVGAGAYPQEMTAEETPLEDFAAFAADEQLEIKEWTVTIKQTVAYNGIEKEIESFLGETVTKQSQTGTAHKKVWIHRHKSGKVVESFSLITHNDRENQAEMVYVLKGTGTSFLTKQSSNQVKRVKSRFFSKNVTIYSCLKTENNGIMNDVLVYQKFKEVFNIKTLNEVIDKDWISRSGYSNHWGQTIQLQEEAMNVQFAVRTLGGRTNITIGTPIITAEY